jgi:hypothetical protein
VKSKEADFGSLSPDQTARLLSFAPQGENANNRDACDINAGLPLVVCSNRDLRDISADGLSALKSANDPPEIFVRMGRLVRVILDEKLQPLIESVTVDALKGRLTRSADYAKYTQKGNLVRIPPPDVVVKDILSLPSLPFPALEAVIEIPVIRPDGSVLDSAGYDAATKLFYIPKIGMKIPHLSLRPTAEELQNAVNLINEALGDFPFVDSASRAAAWAGCLTPILRPLISGRVPLILIDAPGAGTGKGLLCEVIARIATGRPGAVMIAPREDDEMRKRITTLLLGGATIVIFDNLENQLQAPSLASAITAPVWKDRILGGNTEVQISVQVTWLANGNNIRLGGDMPRRSVWSRLDAKVARPWQRTGFKHKDLLGWIDTNRGGLIAAFLTLALAWIAKGRPEFSASVLGGFDDWAKTLGGVLRIAGVDGFLENLDQLYEEADTETAQWEAFLEAWYDRYGSEPRTATELAEDMKLDAQGRGPGILNLLPGNLADFFDKPQSFTRKLGNALARKVEVRYGNLRLVKKGERQRAMLWAVQMEVTGSQE